MNFRDSSILKETENHVAKFKHMQTVGISSVLANPGPRVAPGQELLSGSGLQLNDKQQHKSPVLGLRAAGDM